MSDVRKPVFKILGVVQADSDRVAEAINLVWELYDWQVYDGAFHGYGHPHRVQLTIDDLLLRVQSAVNSVFHANVNIQIFEHDDLNREDEEEDEEEDDDYPDPEPSWSPSILWDRGWGF